LIPDRYKGYALDSIAEQESRADLTPYTGEVYNELSAGFADCPVLKQVDMLIDDKVFRLISLSRQEHRYFQDLIGHLGKGEASCIAYANERKAIVMTDDRTARKQCSLMKIPVTGTVGILKASVSKPN
jgi:predicted nucleic acid-binding protein